MTPFDIADWLWLSVKIGVGIALWIGSACIGAAAAMALLWLASRPVVWGYRLWEKWAEER